MSEDTGGQKPSTHLNPPASMQGGGEKILDYITEQRDPRVVHAIAQFVWSEFSIVNGCVLLPWAGDEESVGKWLVALSGDANAVENTIKHLHLWDVIDEEGDDIDQILKALSRMLAKSWKAALADQFPSRVFDVSYSNDECDYGPTVYIRSC